MKPKQSIYLCILVSCAVANFIVLISAWTSNLYTISYTVNETKLNSLSFLQPKAYIHYGADKLTVYDYNNASLFETPKLVSYTIKYKDCPASWCDDVEEAGGTTFGTAVAAWVFSLLYLIALVFILFRKQYEHLLKLVIFPLISFALTVASLIGWIKNGQGNIKNYLPLPWVEASYDDRTSYDMLITIGITMIYLIISVVIQIISLCLAPCARVMKTDVSKDVDMQNR